MYAFSNEHWCGPGLRPVFIGHVWTEALFVRKNLRFHMKTDTCGPGLRPCKHVSIFIWKRSFFLTNRVSVHTRPIKKINENGTFRKRSPEWNFLKTLFSRVRVDRRKRNFSKTLRRHYQFQFTPPIIRHLLKMVDGRFPFLSFILGLISNLIA